MTQLKYKKMKSDKLFYVRSFEMEIFLLALLTLLTRKNMPTL